MSYRRSSKRDYQVDGTIAGAVVAALIASVSFGGLIGSTGNRGAIAALYGLEGLTSDWVFIVVHGFVGAAPFVVGLTRAAQHRYAPAPLAAALRSPFIGGCLGVAYGTLCWLVVVAVGVPLWVGLTGGHLPAPVFVTPAPPHAALYAGQTHSALIRLLDGALVAHTGPLSIPIPPDSVPARYWSPRRRGRSR